jgi:hypothetical protein
MTAALARKARHVDLLNAFTERAAARAYLWFLGEYTLHDAVDVLQRDAERDGLVESVGQDVVQRIIADAFQQHRDDLNV